MAKTIITWGVGGVENGVFQVIRALGLGLQLSCLRGDQSIGERKRTQRPGSREKEIGFKKVPGSLLASCLRTASFKGSQEREVLWLERRSCAEPASRAEGACVSAGGGIFHYAGQS